MGPRVPRSGALFGISSRPSRPTSVFDRIGYNSVSVVDCIGYSSVGN